MGDLEVATEEALAAASHLTGMDSGAVKALRTLARKIDQDEERWALALAHAAGSKTKPPSPDNVSLPTYLKYCESLGLTPAGRLRFTPSKGAEGGKLGQLRSVAST